MRQDGYTLDAPEPFFMGRYEVTVAEYRRVMRSVPSPGTKPEDETLPVVFVTGLNAEKFCRVLSELPAEIAAGRRYRLPAAMEWEYACRCGASEHFFRAR